MQRVALYKDPNVETVNLGVLYEEIKTRKLSGYLHFVYWEGEDYLVFIEGEASWGLSVERDGKRKEIKVRTYTPPKVNGKVSFYEVPLLNLLLFKRQSKVPPDPYSFTSYGAEFLGCVRSSHIDRAKLLEQIKRTHLDGYMVACSRGGFEFMVMFQKGHPVCSYQGDRYVWNKTQRIGLGEDSYLAIYSTEPEFPLILSSMDTIKKGHERTFTRSEEIKDVRKEIEEKKLNALLDIFLSTGSRIYEIFYKGLKLLGILQDKDTLQENTLEPSSGTFTLYTLEIRESLSPIEIEFGKEEQKDYVKEEIILAVKNHFIEEIGPLGAFLWSKIVKDRGYDERRMTQEQLNRLIDILFNEIPDSTHANRFLDKVRRYKL